MAYIDVVTKDNVILREFDDNRQVAVIVLKPRTGYLYPMLDPFSNCQVMCIGNMEDLLRTILDSVNYPDALKQCESVIQDILDYMGKRQTIIDVKKDYVEAAKKLFGHENLMWEQSYTNGTHTKMCTMMFVNSKFRDCPMEGDDEDDDWQNDSDDDD